MKRRDFLRTGAAGAALICIPGMGFFSCTKNVIDPTIDPITGQFCSPVNVPEDRGGFYTLFINGTDYKPNDLDLNSWRLKFIRTDVNRNVKQEGIPLDFNEIATKFSNDPDNYEVSFFQTFQCVGNLPGGFQISNGYFTGVPLRKYLETQLGANWYQGANRVYFRCHDGYSSNQKVDRILVDNPAPIYLVYKFDGIPFSKRREGSLKHGYPVRLVAPEMLGMKSPKALVEIEVSDSDEIDGYWETRPTTSDPSVTWADIPLMKINSRIYDPVNYQKMRRGTTYRMTGVAFGGINPATGNESPLEKMEIGIATAPNRLEHGPITWHEATIRSRPTDTVRPDYDDSNGQAFQEALTKINQNPWPAPFIWSLWDLDLPVPQNKGNYRLFARATGADGNTQPTMEEGAQEADGNNGQHSLIIQAE